jgi:hypothetical protein
MPILTDHFYNITKISKTNTYIETGTYLGDGVTNVLNYYTNIHSIELSEKWYNYNTEKFKNNKNVKIHFGDSKKVLPELLNSVNEPITIYLDAHYSGEYTSYGEEETPLLFELEILKNRQFDDIIIIDDCRMLGKTGESGSINNPVYPLMIYDWINITEDKIVNLMKPGYILLKNDGHQYTNGASDQFILARQM